MSALELRDVVVDYHRRSGGSVRAVAGASLVVERGQLVGLVGESGCGKSTLARAAVGLVRTAAGTVMFEGEPVAPLTRRKRPHALVRLQLVFQNPYSSLNPRRSVGSQLGDGVEARSSRARAVRVGQLCELVGLPATAPAGSGSGSRSRARSPPTRASSSSTSRSRHSTPRRRRNLPTCCAT
jgi:ABC-type glutathione transport system ATPase component